MDKRKIIAHLRALGTGKIQPHDTTEGICYGLWHTFEIPIDDLIPYFRTWSKFSGDVGFPVPCTGFSAMSAYGTILSKWANNQYGNDRRELCLHITNEMEKELTGG